MGEGSGQSAVKEVRFLIQCVISAVNDRWNTHLTVFFQQ